MLNSLQYGHTRAVSPLQSDQFFHLASAQDERPLNPHNILDNTTTSMLPKEGNNPEPATRHNHCSAASASKDETKAWTGPRDPLEGADSMTGLVGELSDNHEFFGCSSAGSFMQQIRAGIDLKLGIHPRSSEPGTGCGPSSLQQYAKTSTSHKAEFEYVLPSRKTADALAKGYWDLIYPTYPFLDRISFEEAYQALWTGSQTKMNERVLVCTVNVIFALGSQVSETVKPEERQETGKKYFDRAESLLEGYFWDAESIELISCFLLTGVYLQTVSIPRRCWMVIGHAIRMAQSLGLHLTEANADHQSSRRTEVARRIWHGCVLMDR